MKKLPAIVSLLFTFMMMRPISAHAAEQVFLNDISGKTGSNINAVFFEDVESTKPKEHMVESTENDVICELSRDELIELACNVFPEYATSIRGENLSSNAYSQRSYADPVVISETRRITNDTSLTYQEHASGRSISVLVRTGITSTSQTAYGPYTDYTASLNATCNFSTECFRINGFRYRCTSDMTDVILDRGTLAGEVSFSAYDTYQLNEVGNVTPYANYVANFTLDIFVDNDEYAGTLTLIYPAYITVRVTNGMISITGY